MEKPKTPETKTPEPNLSSREQKMKAYKELGFDYEDQIQYQQDQLAEAKKGGDIDTIQKESATLTFMVKNDEALFRDQLKSDGLKSDTPEHDNEMKAFMDINFSHNTRMAEQKIENRKKSLLVENEKLSGKNKIETLKNHLIGNKDIKRTTAELEEKIRLEGKKLSNIDKAKFEYSIRNKNEFSKLFARGSNKLEKLKDHFTTPEKKKQLFTRLKRSAMFGVGAGLLTIGTGGVAGLVAGTGLALTRSFGGFVGAEAAQGVIGAKTKDSRMDFVKLRNDRPKQLSKAELAAMSIKEQNIYNFEIAKYNQKRDSLLEGRGKKLRNKNKFKNVLIGASALAGSLSAGGIIEIIKGENFINPFKRFANIPNDLIGGVQGWISGDVNADISTEDTNQYSKEAFNFANPDKMLDSVKNDEVYDGGTLDEILVTAKSDGIPSLASEGVKLQSLDLTSGILSSELVQNTIENVGEKPGAEIISGDIFIKKGEGVTYAFLRQLNAKNEMGEKLRDYLNITGKANGTDAFRVAKELGYIGENDEVRVNFGKGAGYELKLSEGKLNSVEHFGGHVDVDGNYVGGAVHETHASGQPFEGKGIENRSTSQNYEYIQPRGTFETNQPETILTPIIEPPTVTQTEAILTPLDKEIVPKKSPLDLLNEEVNPIKKGYTEGVIIGSQSLDTGESVDEPKELTDREKRQARRAENKRMRQERRMARIKSGKGGGWLEKAALFLTGAGVGYGVNDIIEDGRSGGSSTRGNIPPVNRPTEQDWSGRDSGSQN